MVYQSYRFILDNSLRFTLILLSALLAGSVCYADDSIAKNNTAIVPLVHAHAHNDYHHKRPLFDALENGFCSVEADIFLVDGKLLVGHNFIDLRKGRTLQSLYLDPLRKRIRNNKGRVYPKGPQFTLLIDIKSDGKKTYTALSKVLVSYADILTKVEKGKETTGAVTAIISGNRPIEMIKKESIRYAGIDGRLSDLKSKNLKAKIPSHLMPLISDNWRNHFTWRGKGMMPAKEREKLHKLVKQAHAAGYRVRFWATSESTALWKELRAANVDLVGTDNLSKLNQFLSAESKEE